MAQTLPQPTVQAIHNPCDHNILARGLWFDQNGDIDLGSPGSWFYTKVENGGNSALTVRLDRPGPACTTFGPADPLLPNVGCLDFDATQTALWAGSYYQTGRLFKYRNDTGWLEWFNNRLLFHDTFIHDTSPDLWDGLAILSDGTLYVASDLGFNIFHVDASVQGGPQKLPDSFVVPFPKSGIEVNALHLFIACPEEAKVYVYSREGKYPLGHFEVHDIDGRAREIEDVDLRVDGQALFLVGSPVGANVGSGSVPMDFLQWDVKTITSDTDNDDVLNPFDNCVGTVNPDQKDSNNDGVGDACTSHTLNSDGDSWPDYLDNCPYASNSTQADSDRDGRGDACDTVTQCFSAESPLPLLEGALRMAIADLDNDGDGDVVTLHHRLFNSQAKVDVVSIRWSGTHGSIGPFSETVEYAVATGQKSRDLVLSDVNNDGFVDIAIVHDNVEPSDDGLQPAVAPEVVVLWNDHNNRFGELTRGPFRFDEHSEQLTAGHPVSISAIRLDGPNDPYPELVVVGYHSFSATNHQATITAVRYVPETGELDASLILGLTGFKPLRAIAMPPKVGQPERDIAMLLDNNTVAIHRCTFGIHPYFETTGYSAPVLNSGNNSAKGRDLGYAHLRAVDWYDLVVIPDDNANDIGSRVVNVFLNNRDAQTLTPGNGGVPQQLTNTLNGRLWKLINYPSYPYDGILVLNEDNPPEPSAEGVQVSRFYPAAGGQGLLDVTGRQDIVDDAREPARAAMALGDISRSCGRDLLVADFYGVTPAPGTPTPDRLFYSRCPFDADSRSFERAAPSTPTCAAIADLDSADGADIIVGTSLDENGFIGGRVMVFRQTSHAPNRFPLTPSETYLPQINGVNVTDAVVTAMAVGEFGAGSRPDLVISFTRDDGEAIQVLRRDTTTAFAVLSQISIAQTSLNGQIKALATGDFDMDGKTDVMVLTDNLGNTNLFMCRGLDTSGLLAGPVPVDEDVVHTGTQLALTRGAAGLDLLTLLPDNPGPPPPFQPTTPSVRRLFNTGGGVFENPADLEVPMPSGGEVPTPVAVVTGNSPMVASPYFACADFANRRVLVYADDGHGYELKSSMDVGLTTSPHPTSIAAADLEADGDDDLVIGFDDGNTVTVLTNVSIARPFMPMTLPSGGTPRIVITGDIDGNGLPDILEVGGDYQSGNSHFRVIFSNCGGV